MLVVIANDLPPAVRGRMKLWFVEPKPNVFVSGIKDSVADDVIEYLYSSCPRDSGILVFQRINSAPHYKIWGIGDPNHRVATITGLQLVFQQESENQQTPSVAHG